jgi:hypothetical protein
MPDIGLVKMHKQQAMRAERVAFGAGKRPRTLPVRPQRIVS